MKEVEGLVRVDDVAVGARVHALVLLVARGGVGGDR